jgi:hypothetical protein
MIVWCNLDKREVLSEADCYYCPIKKIIDICPFFMGIKDAPKKEYEKYQREHLKYNERKNMEYIRKDEVLKIIKDLFDNYIHVRLYHLCYEIRKLKTYKGINRNQVIEEEMTKLLNDNIIKKMFCPENCAYLLINEEEQDEFAEHMNYCPDHLCSKYKCRLIHGIYHPKILREKGCDEI